MNEKREYHKIGYKNFSIEEKKQYHNNKTVLARQNKREYYLKFLRGRLGRYVKEFMIFNKEDIKYLESIKI